MLEHLHNPQQTRRHVISHPALYTDYYELTMAQGYVLEGRAEQTATFDYFFRDLPFNGGYVLFAGISDLLKLLDEYRFGPEELAWLKEQGFKEPFLDYLGDMELELDILSVQEGEVVFPREPLVRVEGPVVQAQLLETLLLNILNFESLIATKASRMTQAAGSGKVLDFGLRRAQGYGGLQASKAAIIGGVEATSNSLSAFLHGTPASGTMAHSWVQSFDTELESFRAFARCYPDNSVLLVDTYDTLRSGMPNAIKVAHEMEERGNRLKGIRLDSGDLAYFSRKAREMLDEAGLGYVKIAVSNQLDERLIKSLLDQGAPVDLFGVGTRLVTGHESPALDGVYKLAAIDGDPRLKISENIEKITLPGRKKVLRYTDGRGRFYGDGIVLEEDVQADTIYHPYYPAKHTAISGYDAEELMQPVMEGGRQTAGDATAQESADYASRRLEKLMPEHKRFENPHIYKVGIGGSLMDLRDELTRQIKKQSN
ncbi:MAG: nicotinate phosphoribosyltransferase [Balneolaceae bacterium]|nr:nicotinate phosphoribosyltransferase [Balneolaceae bacterium]